MYATSRQVDGATFYQLRWTSCDDRHLADGSDDDKQNYATHIYVMTWILLARVSFLHSHDTF